MTFLILSPPVPSVISFKTFGIPLEEVLVNELTRSKRLELRAAIQMEESTGQAAGHLRANVVQRIVGHFRRFFSRRQDGPSLPGEFTRHGLPVS